MTRHLAAAAIAGAVLSLSAQESSQNPPQPRQIFRTEANLVRVDVHVWKDGGPVPDLTEDDFEVLEDGVRQKIDSLEFVRVEAPQSRVPVEPSSTAAAMELAADSRNRVFILFLDAYHVSPESSVQTPMALVRMIDGLIGPTDLIGLMTPDMDIRDLILSRKTDVLRNGLLQSRRWGRMVKDCRLTTDLDDTERMYSICYPCVERDCPPCVLSTAALEMIRRRRLSFTFGVLSELVRNIGARREARTAFILVSEGWPLPGPNDALSNLGASEPPQIRIGPGGRLGTRNPGVNTNIDQDLCARHLREVAQEDYYRRFRDLIDDANRNNASFYIVDPGGLRTGLLPPDAMRGYVPPRGYVDTLRTLADNTDGNAIVDTNDIKGGLLRVVNDLSGYYLIGYYSTNTKSDGAYRSIKVKVSRPGVDVRARKGYRAWTAEDVEAMNAARAAVPAAPVAPEAAANANALARLARLKPATPFYVHATIDAAQSALYVTGELAPAAAKSAAWRQGGEAQILVSGPDGSPAASGRATIAPGARSFLAHLPLSGKAPGAYEIAVRLRATAGSTLLETAQATRTGDALGEPLAFRSPTREDPVAAFAWWRTEHIRLEAPLAVDAPPPAGRLLDRAGKPLPVPVDVTVRSDAGSRWAVATFKLAPLSPGDYVVELTAGSVRRVIALRVAR